MILSGTQVRTDMTIVPWVFFFSLLKMRVMFPLFPLLGTSLHCDDFSNMTDSALVTLSASSFRTYGCISSGALDLCNLRFLKVVLKLIFSYSGLFFVPPVPAFAFWGLGFRNYSESTQKDLFLFEKQGCFYRDKLQISSNLQPRPSEQYVSSGLKFQRIFL